MMPMEYSVLIRVRNAATTLPGALESLRKQSLLPHEIWVVDDHSSDESAQIARKYGAKVISYPSDRPFSYSHALNVGMAAVTTPYTLVLSAHAQLLQPEAMEHAVTLMNAHPSAALISFTRMGPSGLDHQSNPSIRHENMRIRSTWNWKTPLADNSCNLLRTSDWAEQPFSEEIPSWEDQYWLKQRMGVGRVALHQPEIVYAYRNTNFIPEKVAFDGVVASRWIHGGRLTRTIWHRRLKAAVHTLLGNRDKAAYNWKIARLIAKWRRLPNEALQFHELVRPAFS